MLRADCKFDDGRGIEGICVYFDWVLSECTKTFLTFKPGLLMWGLGVGEYERKVIWKLEGIM